MNQAGVFESTDGGATWAHIFDPSLFYISSITFVNELNGWLCGLRSVEGGTILHTTDGGTTWSEQESGTRAQLQKIRFVNTEKGWAVGLGAMLYTSDGGDHWILDTAAIIPDLFDVFPFVDGDRVSCWAAGTSGSVFFHEGMLTSARNPDLLDTPEHFLLEQNYPNPFNPVTKIRFVMGDVGYVSLKVYDLLGREVATLVNEKLGPGSYTRQWDPSGMASGVYYYRLRAGEYVQTKKLILLR